MGDTPQPTPPPADDATIKRDVERAGYRTVTEEVTSSVVSGPIPGMISKAFADGLTAAGSALLELLIKASSRIGEEIGKDIDNVEKVAGPTLLKAAAAGLSDYFGVDITADELGIRGGTDQRRAASEKIGKFVLARMFGELGEAGPITPEQGSENASRMLGFNLSTALEGWLAGILGSSILSSLIPNWADLDEIVASNLGLGRLNRRIMAPLLNLLVVEPHNWDLNKRFRQRIFSDTQAVRALFRGETTDEEYFETMARLGWSRERAATLKVVNGRLPEKEDFARMLESKLITEEELPELFGTLGFEPGLADVMSAIVRDDRVRTLNNALESLARDMFRDREIDEQEFRRLIKVAQRSEVEEAILVGIAFIERSRPKRLTRAQMERAFDEGLIDLGRLRDFYLEEGFAITDALILEQLVVKKKLEREAAEFARAEAQKAKAAKEKR